MHSNARDLVSQRRHLVNMTERAKSLSLVGGYDRKIEIARATIRRWVRQNFWWSRLTGFLRIAFDLVQPSTHKADDTN